jgi:hypothetical protein
MPFKSESQRRYMWSQHPDIARKWTDKYGSHIVKAYDETVKKRKKKKK